MAPANGKNPNGVDGANLIARTLSSADLGVTTLLSSDVCRAKQTASGLSGEETTPSFTSALAPVKAGGSAKESHQLLASTHKSMEGGTLVAISHADLMPKIANAFGYQLERKLGAHDGVVFSYDTSSAAWSCAGTITDWSKLR